MPRSRIVPTRGAASRLFQPHDHVDRGDPHAPGGGIGHQKRVAEGRERSKNLGLTVVEAGRQLRQQSAPGVVSDPGPTRGFACWSGAPPSYGASSVPAADGRSRTRLAGCGKH